MKVYIESYGCTSNLCDAGKMEYLLRKAGFSFVNSHEKADVTIINTCTVTKFTEKKMLRRIKEIRGSGKKLVIAGCLPAAQPELVENFSVETITPQKLHQICAKLGAESDAENVSPSSGIRSATGFVSICEGCSKACSYCIVKKARGNLKSYSMASIEAEVKALVKSGASEVQITAQDVSAYGLDFDGKANLADLIRRVSAIEGNFMVRVGMMNPATAKFITEELVEAFDSPKVFKFLHLPLQSASNRILEKMNRGYLVEEYCDIVSAFRTRHPELLLSTDYIVGFPGESEEDFELSRKNLIETRPIKVNITRFSPRPYTGAKKMPDLPYSTKKERSAALSALHREITSEYYRSLTGGEMRVLTTEEGRGNSTVARDTSYKNIVIGEVLPLGNWVDVKIVGSSTTYAIAEVLR